METWKDLSTVWLYCFPLLSVTPVDQTVMQILLHYYIRLIPWYQCWCECYFMFKNTPHRICTVCPFTHESGIRQTDRQTHTDTRCQKKLQYRLSADFHWEFCALLRATAEGPTIRLCLFRGRGLQPLCKHHNFACFSCLWKKIRFPKRKKKQTNEPWGNLLLKKLNNSYVAFIIIALLPLFWVLSLLPVLPHFGESFTEEAE